MTTENLFEKLYKINVKDHVEKKGQFSYLSWPYAVAELRKAAPDATWETIKFNGQPYCETKAGCFVEVAVTVNGITLSQIHPVLDMRNRPIPSPDAFHINTSIQRCLVKAIALHGLGLYIYAGEDLPESDEAPVAEVKPQLKSAQLTDYSEEEQQFLRDMAIEMISAVEQDAVIDAYNLTVSLDNDEKSVLWNLLDSKTKTAVKKYAESLKTLKKAA